MGAVEVGGALAAGSSDAAGVLAAGLVVEEGEVAVVVVEAAWAVADGAGVAGDEAVLPTDSVVEGSALLQPPARRTNDRIRVGVTTIRRVEPVGQDMA